MRIGIPKERKPNEKRVALTPSNAKILTNKAYEIFIEQGAGLGSGFSDEEYKAAGVTILPSLEEIWATAELLLKVKEPAPEEFELMREDQIVFSFLHPAADKTLTEKMLEKKIIGLDYDLVETSDRRLPILEPMSMIAGALSIHCGAESMLSQNAGQGLLLEKFLDSPPANVLVIGAGTSGTEAIRKAYRLGAHICVLDISEVKLESLKKGFPELTTKLSNKENLLEELPKSDLIIGAVLVPGAKAPTLITKSMLSLCKKGTVFVDISIDQGGIAETSKVTTLNEPRYIVDGVIHYCVSNMPAMVPRTATIALSNRTLPYLLQLHSATIESILTTDNDIRKSLVCHQGKITNKHIAEAFDLDYHPIKLH